MYMPACIHKTICLENHHEYHIALKQQADNHVYNAKVASEVSSSAFSFGKQSKHL